MVRFFFIIALLTQFSACGLLNGSQSTQSNYEISEEDYDSRQLMPVEPVRIEIVQSFFEGQHFHVKLHLTALSEMDPSSILVSIAGLRQGEKVEQKSIRVDSVVDDDTLEEQSLVALSFVLEEQNLTEYQITCAWGKDAVDPITEYGRGKLSEKVLADEPEYPEVYPKSETPIFELENPQESIPYFEPSLVLQELEVIETPIDCNRAPCDVQYVIEGYIYNEGNALASEATIAVGLYWAKYRKLPRLPQPNSDILPHEEVIRLNNLSLAPDGRQKIKVTLDKPVPVVRGGSFIPHIRIIKHSNK